MSLVFQVLDQVGALAALSKSCLVDDELLLVCWICCAVRLFWLDEDDRGCFCEFCDWL